jgi:hypothetical protein
VGALRTAGATATSMVVTDLPAGSSLRFLVAAVNAVGTGTFSAESNAVTPVETVAPAVTAKTPADAATGILIGTNPTVTFSEPVTGVNGTTMVLRNAATNATVEATVTYTVGNMTAVLDPVADLAANTRYQVTVTGGATAIRDAFDNPVATTAWSFTTEAVAALTVKNVDFTSDGNADVVSRDGNGRLWLYPSNGAGALQTRIVLGSSGWNAMNAIASPGDFNRDGKADIIAKDSVGSGQLWFYPGDGAGNLGARVLIGSSGWNAMNTVFGAGDVNKDGDADLITRDTSGRLWLYPGNGTGRLETRQLMGSSGWNSITSLHSSGDFNGDTNADVIARTSDGLLWMYPGNGRAGLSPRVQIGTGWNSMSAIFSPGDLTGDGKADVVSRDSGGRLLLYPGNGTGRLVSPQVIGNSGWNAMSILF